MARSAGLQRGTTATEPRTTTRETGPVDGEPDRLLDLLGDEYTRAVLEAIRDAPMSGAAVAEAASVSKPTAFRRLNELVDLGVAETRQCVDPDGGHHCKEYRLVVDSLSVSVGDDGLAVTVEESATDDGGAATDDRGTGTGRRETTHADRLA